VAAVAGSFTGQFLAKYYAEHGMPGEAPADLTTEEVAAVEEEVAGRTKMPSKKTATKKAVSAEGRGLVRKKTGDTKVDEKAEVAAKAERARKAARR